MKHSETPTLVSPSALPAQRLPYEPPRIEVYSYTVEQGYASSVETVDYEQVTEISNEEGDNYHGEWF